MGSQIDELLARYWDGETTLQEEAQIREYFQRQPSLTPDGRYFRELNLRREIEPGEIRHPGRIQRRAWLSIAASVTIGLIVAVFVIHDARQTRDFVVDDPQEAYEITRKALFMVSSTLNEGSTYSNELKKINKAEKIVNELEK